MDVSTEKPLCLRKVARPAYDARLLRFRQRDLDDVDAEESRVLIGARTRVRTPGELFTRAHRARPGTKDIYVALVIGVGHHGVRVRASARLDRGHLLRDPHVADRLRHSLKTAVEPAPCLLDRHDEKVADDGQITLTTRAHHGA